MTQERPICPICNLPMWKNGSVEGRQRWRCVKNAKNNRCGIGQHLDDALDRGRPTKFDRAMTNAERQRRWKDSRKGLPKK